MGSCISHVDPESLKLHAEAEEILKKAKRKMDGEAKVLLLGSGDSGKSTVIKQMRILTKIPWTQIELESYRQIVFLNLIDGMKGIFQSLEDLGISLTGDPKAMDAYNCILKAPGAQVGEPFPPHCYDALSFLWSHAQIQDGLMRSTRPLPDNIYYYFPKLDRLFMVDYVPSNQDILYTRARTTGIVEHFFNTDELHVNIPGASSSASSKMKSSTDTDLPSRSPQSLSPPQSSQTLPSGSDTGTLRPKRSRSAIVSSLLSIRPVGARQLHMIDVGGQRCERRKWIHCFEGVTAILFLVSLSGYDQALVEASDANQMMDAMAIWDGICSLEYFRTTDIILFLNKVDLFEQKVLYSPINRFFPDYSGPEKDAKAGKEYFKTRFMRIATKSKHWKGMPEAQDRLAPRAVYEHFTTAVNTQMIGQVMQDVADIVLRDNFTHTHLI